jgi:hypothetical protein
MKVTRHCSDVSYLAVITLKARLLKVIHPSHVTRHTSHVMQQETCSGVRYGLT